jgi:hypothetical protein
MLLVQVQYVFLNFEYVGRSLIALASCYTRSGTDRLDED